MRHLHIQLLCVVTVARTRLEALGRFPRERGKEPMRRTGLPLPKDGLFDDEPHKDIQQGEEGDG